MTSTPTLFNSGTLRPQLSSCFISTIPDSAEGIMGAITDNALLSKHAGGIGNDWTLVRGMGAHIKGTNGKSGGVVPFMKIANDGLVAFNQSGKRRGSGCAYLETWHIDIEEFLELRKNTGDERRRTHDMNTANWIPDLFLERVHENQSWTLFSPDEVPQLHNLYGTAFRKTYEQYEETARQGQIKIWKQVSAIELWRKMLTMLYETGHPWLCFSGDTKVAVADGRNAISIKELAESNIPIPVYSARPVSKNALNFNNKSQRCWTEEIKMATAFKTGRRELIRVHLDDGSFFRCTEDHLLALKEGGYIRADLSAGQSLFPFNSWNDVTHPNNCYIKLKGKEKPDRYGLSKADLISEGRKFYVKYGTLSNLVWRKHFREERLPSCGYVLNRFRKWSLFIDSCVNNHKVVRIEKIGEFEDVYDLSVEDNHNFFIITHETKHFNSGVLVHNCFKDPCNLRNPQQHIGVVHSSNLCTEICLNTNFQEIAVCNLASINLSSHLREGKLDLDKLQRTIRIGMRMLDNVIDINYYSVPQAKTSNLRHRPVGLGIMGFQDALYQLRIPYASQEAIEFADYAQEVISYYAILTSTKLAQERGSYSTFPGSLWSQGILPIDSINLLAKERGQYLDMSTTMTLDWDSLRERVKTIGMRNSNCMALAPTATISNVCGVTQSIEPTYQNLFVKSNLSGEFTIINPYLVRDLKALGLWDEVMVNDLKYCDGSVREIERVPPELRSLYATAFEIDPTWLVEAASRRQKWLDQSQSLNLYMLEPSGRKLDNLYRLAWIRGLKTTYYLRSLGATRVQKSTVSHYQFNTTPTISQTCALEDPECEACQ